MRRVLKAPGFLFSFLLFFSPAIFFLILFEIPQSLNTNQEQPLQFPHLPVPLTSKDYFTRTCRSLCAIIFFALFLYRQLTLPKAFPGQVPGCPPGAGTETTTPLTQGAGGEKNHPKPNKMQTWGYFWIPCSRRVEGRGSWGGRSDEGWLGASGGC